MPITQHSLNMQWNANNFLNRSSSFGIPVDNVTLEEATDAVFNFIERYNIDHTPKLVSTLNVDFLVNCLGYSFDKPRHPELLNILRSADLVTADGFPIVLFSKIAGCALKARVTGADLTPAVAKVAAERGKSIYFLGGTNNSAKQAAAMLQAQHPNLQIAGTDEPMVATTGAGLCGWRETDAEIIDRINASGADILLIGFGNPKQELWFSRNKYRLKVPVSIGIGGTFAFITGQVKRAPKILQACNLEWLYRMCQEPRRLFKRYALGGIKFAVLSLPIIRQRFQQDLLGAYYGNEDDNQRDIEWCTHWSSRHDVLMTLRLPNAVSRHYMENLVLSLREQMRDNRIVRTYIIDFSQVEVISMAACQAFSEVSGLINNGDGIYIGMTNKVRKQLEKSRVLDIASNADASLREMQNHIHSGKVKSAFECKTYTVGAVTISYLSGEVTGEKLMKMGFLETLCASGNDRANVIDLRHAALVDTAAIGEFLNIVHSVQDELGRDLFFSGITEKLQQAFKVAHVTKQLNVINDQTFSGMLFPTEAKGTAK